MRRPAGLASQASRTRAAACHSSGVTAIRRPSRGEAYGRDVGAHDPRVGEDDHGHRAPAARRPCRRPQRGDHPGRRARRRSGPSSSPRPRAPAGRRVRPSGSRAASSDRQRERDRQQGGGEGVAGRWCRRRGRTSCEIPRRRGGDGGESRWTSSACTAPTSASRSPPAIVTVSSRPRAAAGALRLIGSRPPVWQDRARLVPGHARDMSSRLGPLVEHRARRAQVGEGAADVARVDVGRGLLRARDRRGSMSLSAVQGAARGHPRARRARRDRPLREGRHVPSGARHSIRRSMYG